MMLRQARPLTLKALTGIGIGLAILYVDLNSADQSEGTLP